MNKNTGYTGAYSRRRYSNFSTGTETPLKGSADPTGGTQQVILRVDYDQTLGQVAAADLHDGAITAPKGTQVQLEATPIGNARFVCWNASFRLPAGAATSNPINITLKGNDRIKAVFAAENQNTDNIFIDPNVINPHIIDGLLPPPQPFVRPNAGGAGLVGKAVAFAKKWWWALLVVAVVIYDKKGGGQ